MSGKTQKAAIQSPRTYSAMLNDPGPKPELKWIDVGSL